MAHPARYAGASSLAWRWAGTMRKVGMTTVREPRRLPVILSPEEVRRLLDAAPGLKYRAALSVAYGADLRASEVVSLKTSDIDSDSERMVIRVERGKGRKDRYAMLSQPLLELLRAWWLAARPLGVMLPGGWLFPGQNPVNPLPTRHGTAPGGRSFESGGGRQQIRAHRGRGRPVRPKGISRRTTLGSWCNTRLRLRARSRPSAA